MLNAETYRWRDDGDCSRTAVEVAESLGMRTPLQQPRNLVFLSQAFQYPDLAASDLLTNAPLALESSLEGISVRLDR